jgi:pyrophosphate--fructose-6-phosphate 1-phosphotransferase
VESPAFRITKYYRDTWLSAAPVPDPFRRPGPIRFSGKSEEDRPLTLVLNALASGEE